MNEEDNPVELITKAAEQYGVAPALLEQLLALERNFTNFTLYGARADFARQVARILEEAAGQGDL